MSNMQNSSTSDSSVFFSSNSTPRASTVKSNANPLVTAYLVLYNAASCVGWGLVWTLTLHHLLTDKQPVSSLLSAVWFPLAVTQSLAALEIVHSAIGLVRSPVISAVMQVSSRLLLVWGIVYIAPSTVHHLGFTLMVCSWASVEIPRYAFYTVNLLCPQCIPSVLTWLRYSLFAVLYPTGITGEVWCIWRALPDIQQQDRLNYSMPNTLNFAFYYWIVLYYVLAIYPFGSHFMYSHMLRQRRKVLGTNKQKTH